MRKRPGRGVSREQWLQAALDVLNKSGIDQVTIYHLARKLGVARSGFYWHFAGRSELLEAMLREWWAFTTIITEDAGIHALDPASRLTRTAEMVHDLRLTRFDVAVNHWAMQNERAAKQARLVSRKRTSFVREAFAELGFAGDALDVRTMLFVCHTTWEPVMFPQVPRKRRRDLIGPRIALLTQRD